MKAQMKALPLLVAMAVVTMPSAVYSDIPEHLNKPATTSAPTKKSNTCLKAEKASDQKKASATAALQKYKAAEVALRDAKSALRDAERDVRTLTAQKANTIRLLEKEHKLVLAAMNKGDTRSQKLYQDAADKYQAKLRDQNNGLKTAEAALKKAQAGVNKAEAALKKANERLRATDWDKKEAEKKKKATCKK
jgi:Tfp pilus assembly protein PilX